MIQIIENNFDPNKKYEENENVELGQIVCPVCESKIIVENKDIYHRDSWHNGILGPGGAGGCSKMFRCPACEWYLNGAYAKHWDRDEDGTLYIVEDRREEEYRKKRAEKNEKLLEERRQQLIEEGKNEEEIEFLLRLYSVQLDSIRDYYL